MKTFLKIWDETGGQGYIAEPQVQIIHGIREAATSGVWRVSARVQDVDYPLTQGLRRDLAEKGIQQLLQLVGEESTRTVTRIISWDRQSFAVSFQ
jgi:hypothetical protein